MNFSPLDIAVFSLYCIIVIGIALWVSRKKKGEEQNTKDYFLAGNTLPWWAIGTSLIAANISAEQLIGMTGSGYTVGLAIASYELMAAATLIIVGKFFLPIFLEKKIFSMPQFLLMRYDNRVRTIMAVFWLFLYIFVNLTSILYLGAICINKVFGVEIYIAVISIAFFSTIYTVFGGLKAIAYTDPIQVTFLIIGGLLTTYLALNQFSDGAGFFKGLGMLANQFPEKFDMILAKDNANYPSLPGLSVLIGGMWIVNLNYWGCNQYITQRALAAKDLKEAQKGIILAGFLKLFMPLIVVVPGIIAYSLHADINSADEAYPWLLNTFLFPGVKGIAFAALVAAIVGSLSSKTNSIATIFTMDVYKTFFKVEKTDKHLINVGRVATIMSLVIAVPLSIWLAKNIDKLGGGFEFIQKFTGWFSPGIFTIFIFGLFWKRATAKGALWVAAFTLPVSISLSFGPKCFAWLSQDNSLPLKYSDIPFLDQMGIGFLILSLVMIIVSLTTKQERDPKSVDITPGLFKTTTAFNIGAGVIIAFLIFSYYIFW